MDTTIQVLYEDDTLLAVAKPSGMVTHPAYRHPDGALTDAIFARATARGEARPWLLHRLDRDTSGVVLFAKTETGRRALVRQFERHTIRKQYLALVEGTLEPTEGEIDAPLKRDPLDRRRVIVAADGQPALTRYRVLGASSAPEAPVVALVMAEPVTGRTHQIRAHLAARSAVILGDTTYRALAAVAPTHAGAKADNALHAVSDAPTILADAPTLSAPRVMLHAWRLTCRYPHTPTTDATATPAPARTPSNPFVMTAPIPADMLALIGQLRLGDTLAQLQD